MPACRQMSLTGTPASACLRIETICVSMNRDFFMGTSWRKHARKFYFWGLYVEGKLTVQGITRKIEHHRSALPQQRADVWRHRPPDAAGQRHVAGKISHPARIQLA